MSVTPRVTEIDFPHTSGFHPESLVDLFQRPFFGFCRLKEGELLEVAPPNLYFEQVPRASSGEEGLLALKHMEDHPLKHVLTWLLHGRRPPERNGTHSFWQCSVVPALGTHASIWSLWVMPFEKKFQLSR